MSSEESNKTLPKTPSRGSLYKFEHQWGGEDTWYTKGKRWANKQKFPINHLALGVLEWLWNHWVDGKVEMEMASIDRQVKEIGKVWDEEDERNRVKPEVVETGVFGEEGWSISMSNPDIIRGSQESESSMGTGSDEKGLANPLPDPWSDTSGDWNDWAIGLSIKKR